MAGTEREGIFFAPKDQRKFGRLEKNLQDIGGVCEIDVFAVAHDWNPGKRVLNSVRSADVITLELTRNVVSAVLAGDQSQILDRNIFWRRIIQELRENQSDKLIKGVEVNQTVRNAWKRLALHFGDRTQASSLLTVEVENSQFPELHRFLSDEEVDFLNKHNWIIVDKMETALVVINKAREVLDQRRLNGLTSSFPLPLSDNLSLVSDNRDKKNRLDNRYPVTFMKPPDISLVKARELVIEKLDGLSFGLNKSEKESISMDAMIIFLLSHSELKDAEEILYNVYQFASNFLAEKKHIKAIHIGGAFHAKTIAHILSSQIINPQLVRVSVKKDPRFLYPLTEKTLSDFFHEILPVQDILAGIKVEGFEAYANPSHIAMMVRRAIEENVDEFEKRLLVSRLIKSGPYIDTVSYVRRLNQMENELYMLDIASLRSMAENVH